ncbi:MAG: hypothetical protein V4594_21780 [Bacteroidota bacterium]
MRLFQNRKPVLTGGQEETAGKIAGWILAIQRKAADYLNGRAGQLSARTWKTILFVFCLLVGSYCLYLVISAFY